MGPGTWMRSNLTTQGYCLSDAERRELSLALRFSTGLCLTLVVVALALESPVMVFALSGIGLVAGFSARHPFDHLWNRVVRHVVGAPALPPNPARRPEELIQQKIKTFNKRKTSLLYKIFSIVEIINVSLINQIN